jgi:SAM-dependent methyltransferase
LLHRLSRLACGALIVAALAHAPIAQPQAQAWAWDDGSVPFVVTPDEVVDRMLRIAQVGPNDTLIDLGSGDGRVVIGAARRGASALGVDIDPTLVDAARANAARAGVASRARFEKRDLYETELSGASVITMYLLPEVNMKLRPRLLALAPGTRIVSHDWDMEDWPADETIELRAPEKSVGAGGYSKVFLWVVPADAGGDWTGEIPGYANALRLNIRQKFQMLEVEARSGARELVVRGTRLRGREIKLVVTGAVAGRPMHHFFTGTLHGDRIDGEVVISDGENRTTFPWTAHRAR